MSAPVRFLYVHVPFCSSVCPFCSFDVVVAGRGAVDRYLQRLEVELAQVAATEPVDLQTWYFGGGTPSMLPARDFDRLCEMVRRHLGEPRVEFTLEVHPSTASRERIEQWRAAGVTRFSVGVQSFDDDVLTRLGRHHSATRAIETVGWAQETGAVVALDLLLATPGQRLSADLHTAVSLVPHHLSAYALTIEDGTPFARDAVLVDDTTAAAAMTVTERVLTAAGLARYEVSNYAQDGFQCRHNRAYWTNEFVLGVGPSAGSHLSAVGRSDAPEGAVAVRKTNPRFADWQTGQAAEYEWRSAEEHVTDAVFCGLRLVDGLDLDDFSSRYGVRLAERFRDAIADGTQRGWLELDDQRLVATAEGRLHLDAAVSAFL